MESEDITTEGLPPESPGDGDDGESAADEAQENEEKSTDG